MSTMTTNKTRTDGEAELIEIIKGAPPYWSLSLGAHNLTRAEFDEFDGDATHFPARPDDERSEFWSKDVRLFTGDFAQEPFVFPVWVQLFTTEPPVAS